MTTKDERRQAVLGLLAHHGAVQWQDRGQDVAFADAVLELAARLGRVETVPALRPLRVATDDERKARIAGVAKQLGWSTNGLNGSESNAEGDRAHGDGTAAQGSVQGDTAGNSGGRA